MASSYSAGRRQIPADAIGLDPFALEATAPARLSVLIRRLLSIRRASNIRRIRDRSRLDRLKSTIAQSAVNCKQLLRPHRNASMSDDCGQHPTSRRHRDAGPGGRRRSAPPARGRRRSPTTRGWRSRSAAWSSAATMDEARERFAGLVATAPAPRAPHRLSVSARRRRSRRGRPGRLRQGLHAHRVVSRGLAVRGLVHADSHQRLPRSAQGARAPRPLVRAAARSAPRATKPRVSAARRADAIPKRGCWRASGARGWPRAIDRLDGRQRTVFMLCHYGDCTPREVSAMTGLNESTVRVHCFAPRASCAACWEASRDRSRAVTSRKNACSTAISPSARGEPLDPPVAEHLADCDALRRPLRRARRVHGRAAHATATPKPTPCFTPERLRAQQQQIARRLEHVGRAGARHQLPGPHAPRAAEHVDPPAHAARRALVAAAAAAGLFVGVALGASFSATSARGSTGRSAVRRRTRARCEPRGRADAVATRGDRHREPSRPTTRSCRTSSRARAAAHARTAGLRRAHAARARSSTSR